MSPVYTRGESYHAAQKKRHEMGPLQKREKMVRSLYCKQMKEHIRES